MRVMSRSVLKEIKKQALIPLEVLEVSTRTPFDTFTHRFVQNNEPLSIANQTYEPLGYTRGPAQTDANYSFDRVTLRMNDVGGFWSQFLGLVFIHGVRARVRKVFVGLLETSSDGFTIFDGYLGAPSYDDDSVSVEIRSIIAYHNTELPQRLYMPECNWFLGGPGCGIDMTAPVNKRIVIAKPGSTRQTIVDPVGLGDVGAEHWLAGYVQMLEGPDIGLIRPIDRSSPGRIKLMVPFNTDPTSYRVLVRRGCRNHKADCSGRYGNLLNYGGFSEVPKEPTIQG